MKDNCYERLQIFEKVVKKSYGRWRKKLSKTEREGYEMFEALLSEVSAAERFLLDGKALLACFEQKEFGVKDLNGSIKIRNGHLIDPLLDTFVSLDFTICAAVSGEKFELDNFDLFYFFSKDEAGGDIIKTYFVNTCLQDVTSSCSSFREYLSVFVVNHTCVRFGAEKVNLTCSLSPGKDPENRIAAVTTMAAHMCNLIFSHSENQVEKRYARISDCDYVRGPSHRYEAKNFYTYICENTDAKEFRDFVREKRHAHGFTGTGGTKAFHYRQAHWRYYRELGKHVFVKGFYAGRHKPQVNVIR